MKYTLLSETEMEVLDLLWQKGRALSRAEIFDGLPRKKKHPTAINQILNNMMEKKVLRVDGLVRCGKIYGRTYAPSMSREEFVVHQAEELMPEFSPETRFLRTVSAWSENGDIGQETLSELENLLKTRREQLQQESELEQLIEAHKREAETK